MSGPRDDRAGREGRAVATRSRVGDAVAALRTAGPDDPEAWTALYRALWPYVVSLAYRALGGADVAQDVAQTVLLRLYDHRAGVLGDGDEGGRLYAYVRAAVHHASLDALRAATRRTRAETEAGRRQAEEYEAHVPDLLERSTEPEPARAPDGAARQRPSGGPGLDVAAAEAWWDALAAERADVAAARRALGAEDRLVLYLVAAGLSLDEVAGRLGITYAAAAKRVSRARRRLRAASPSERG